MVYLSPEKFFESIFEKEKKFDEEMANFDPNELEDPNAEVVEGVEPKRKAPPTIDKYLTELELKVYNELKSGSAIQPDTLINLYRYIVSSDLAYSRGLIIDLSSVVQEKSHIEQLLSGQYGGFIIDYVIELTMPETELLERIKDFKLSTKSMDVTNYRDIELMKKPKVPKKLVYPDDEVEEDEQPIEEGDPELNEEQLALIPTEKDLIEITNFYDIFIHQLDYYKKVQYPICKEFIMTLKKNYYFKYDVTGQDTDEIVNYIKNRLDFNNPPRSIPKVLEAGDFKDLLTQGRTGIEPGRRWSLWKQTDPVALMDDYLILNGNTEFAIDYCGRVFIFASEENRLKFFNNPKKYLKKPPEVPKKYRIAIFGPPKSGKKTIAGLLNELFNLRTMNIDEIFTNVMDYQKSVAELNSNWCEKIHFSAEEFKEKTVKKIPVDFYSKVVFFLDELGIPLEKKKTLDEIKAERKLHSEKLHHVLNPHVSAYVAPPRRLKQKVVEEVEEGDEEGKLAEDLEKKPEEREGEKKEGEGEEKKEGEGEDGENKTGVEGEGEPEYEEEPSYHTQYVDPFPEEADYVQEDLRSTQFYYAYDSNYQYPRPGGFTLLSHPINEDEIKKFKEFNIKFDKFIYLSDQTETPVKSLAIRINPNLEKLDDEKQEPEINKLKDVIAKFDEVLPLLKEAYGEDNLIELNCFEPIESLRLKLKNIINPFYVRVDPEDKITLQADVAEENIPIPRGEFGLFCPVTYKEEGWLFYGSQEFELQLNQRLYRFAGEREMNLFKESPIYYIAKGMFPIEVPPPHIFLTGYQGAGITELSNLLAKEYKLNRLDILPEFMKIWDKQRLERKSIRTEKKREELIKQKEESKKEAKEADPNAEAPEEMNIEEMLANDEGLNEEGEEFDAAANDKNIFKMLFNPIQPTIYDSSWNDINEKITTPFIDFITEKKRTPNVVIMIKCTQKSIMDRHLDVERIKNTHAELSEKSIEKKKAEVERIKNEKLQAIADVKAADPEATEFPEEMTEDEKKAIMDEPDPELPEYDTLLNAEIEKLKTRYENNVNSITELIESYKLKNIPVFEIDNDLKKENVKKNFLYMIAPYIKNRKNLIEKQLVYTELKDMITRKCKLLEHSNVFRFSAYKQASPVNPEKLLAKTQWPVLYRDRIYYFNDLDERKLFIEEPLNYRSGKEFPLDVNLNKIIFSIGKLKSGKSTIAKILESLGYLKLTLKKCIYDVKASIRNSLLKTDIENLLTTVRLNFIYI